MSSTSEARKPAMAEVRAIRGARSAQGAMKLPRALRDQALLRECAGRAETRHMKGASGFTRWTSSRVRTLGIIFSGEYAERGGYELAHLRAQPRGTRRG